VSTDVGIRPYEPRDRSAVREISCDTADRGNAVESFFSGRRVVADLLTRYYTDYEPQTSWVAEYEGQVIGYLAGCLNSRRHFWMMVFCIVPGAVIGAILRGVLWRKETWRLLGAWVRMWRRGGFFKSVLRERYPAHLHINLRQSFRGQHVGQHLIERFIEQVKVAGMRGISVSVREGNSAACRFFERLGFTPLSRYPIILPYSGVSQIDYTVVYCKVVENGR
jgi:ribosomal protein S18 acetylase RimI-like enzyme